MEKQFCFALLPSQTMGLNFLYRMKKELKPSHSEYHYFFLVDLCESGFRLVCRLYGTKLAKISSTHYMDNYILLYH